MLRITPEPFALAVEELRRVKFTARCSEWDADRQTHTLGRSDVDSSFMELWRAWIILNNRVASLVETIDQSCLVFLPAMTGTEAVRETVNPKNRTFDEDECSRQTKLLRLEGVVQLCRAFKVPTSYDTIECPVFEMGFKPFNDHQFAHSWEVGMLRRHRRIPAQWLFLDRFLTCL